MIDFANKAHVPCENGLHVHSCVRIIGALRARWLKLLLGRCYRSGHPRQTFQSGCVYSSNLNHSAKLNHL